MTWRFSISTDGGTGWTVVSPLNGSKLKIEQSRDLDAGQVFFRKKLTGKPMLGGDDFKLIDAVRRNPSRRCEELLIKCERDCGQWQEYWRGGFTVRGCAWELADCIVTINPKTLDRYTCMLDAIGIRRNVLLAEQVLGGAAISIDISFGYSYSWGPDPGGGLIHASLSGMVDGANDGVNGWGHGYTETVGTWSQNWIDSGSGFAPVSPLTLTGELAGLSGNATLLGIIADYAAAWYAANPTFSLVAFNAIPLYRLIWRRQRYVVTCEFGVSAPPAGSGWTILTDNCAIDNTAIYVRPPTLPYTHGGLYHGTAGPTPPVAPPCSSWTQVQDFWFNSDPMYVCYNSATANVVTMNRGRTMHSVMTLMVEAAECGLAGCRSDFFEWTPPGDAPGYAPGINYYTGVANQVDHLLLFQKTDAILPGASQGATIGYLTLAEAMTMFRVAFRCFWDIDDAGFVRIEHASYWEGLYGIDVSAQEGSIELPSMSGDGGGIPRIEKATWQEARGTDFIGKDIIYDQACASGSDQDGTLEWSPGKFTTDIEFVIDDPQEISKDGFFLMACTIVSGVHMAIVDDGAVSGLPITNAPLSWANLQRDFWTWDRFLPSANMNGADTDFPNFLPTVQQEGVSFRACCSLLAFDPRRRINGALARRLGVLGVVETVSHDLYTDRITLVLRYPY